MQRNHTAVSRLTVALGAGSLIVLAAGPAMGHGQASAPKAPKTGLWKSVKTGSNAKATFRVKGHKLTKLKGHGGDPECSNTTGIMKGSVTLRVVDGASGTAGVSEWVAGKKVPGGSPGLEPEYTHVKDAGHTYRASIEMQFTSATTGSGFITWDNDRRGSSCTMTINVKK